MNILRDIEILRVQLHTSQILIVLGLFLILLCCLLQRVSDLDALHLPRNSYLLITVTHSLIIQLQWLRQKCLSHHFSGCGDQYRPRCQGDGAGLTVASLWQQTCSQTPTFWGSHQLEYFWFFSRLLHFPLSCLEHYIRFVLKKEEEEGKKAWLTLTLTCLANSSQARVIMSLWCRLLYFLIKHKLMHCLYHFSHIC